MTETINTKISDLGYEGGQGLELRQSSPIGKGKFKQELQIDDNKDVLRTLYRICFSGVADKKHMLSSVNTFSGWNKDFHNIEQKESDLRDRKKYNWNNLRKTAKFLHLKPQHSREDLVEELSEFFKKPYKVDETSSAHSSPAKKKSTSTKKTKIPTGKNPPSKSKTAAKSSTQGKSKSQTKIKSTPKGQTSKATKATKATKAAKAKPLNE